MNFSRHHLYFLEKGAQPTGTVHDISKKAGVFTELRLNQQTQVILVALPIVFD